MTTLDTVRTAAETLGEKVRVTETSLEIDDDLDFEAWAELGGRLGLLASSSLWWIGGWIVEGESVYGAKYEAALQVTGLDYGTLRNLKYVYERVDVSFRNDKLSFTHHVAVAPLAPAEQRRWLDVAEREQLTVVALREAIAAGRQLPAPAIGAVPVRITIGGVGPDRAERWRTAAETAGVDFTEWAADALDRAAA